MDEDELFIVVGSVPVTGEQWVLVTDNATEVRQRMFENIDAIERIFVGREVSTQDMVMKF